MCRLYIYCWISNVQKYLIICWFVLTSLNGVDKRESYMPSCLKKSVLKKKGEEKKRGAEKKNIASKG